MFVYKITNITNGKIYVGQTTKSIKTRWRVHVYQAMRANYQTPLHRSIRKNGEANFAMETLATASSFEELTKLETEFILKLDACNPNVGYNLKREGNSNAGENNPMYGKKRPDLVAYVKANPKFGEKNPMYGKSRPDLRKLNARKRGKTLEELYGPERASELRAEQSNRHRGRKCKPFSESHRAKIAEHRKGKATVTCLILDEQTGEVGTVVYFCEKYGLNRFTVYKHLQRKIKTLTKDRLIFTLIEKIKGDVKNGKS